MKEKEKIKLDRWQEEFIEGGGLTTVSYRREGKIWRTAINLWNFMKSAEKGKRVCIFSPDGSSEWERVK